MSKERTPLRVTADMLINYQQKGLVLIQRKWPPYQSHWALPGGHVDVGEEDTLTAAIRETAEETNLVVRPEMVRLLGIYSDPMRDPRGHYVTAAYYCTVLEGELKALDDAQNIDVFPFDNLPDQIAFDHGDIIRDYLTLTEKKRWIFIEHLRGLLKKGARR